MWNFHRVAWLIELSDQRGDRTKAILLIDQRERATRGGAKQRTDKACES